MAVARLDEVSKRFGPRLVLDRVTLSLEAGRTLLVRGRSGSGKTTLLHVLSGAEAPDAGRVEVEGRDVAALDDLEVAQLRLTRIGYVFQHFNLIPDLTAEENVRLPMTLARRPDAKARAADLLDRVGMTSRSRAFPGRLSGGEMQRVAIARALANEPRLILADEPTANLDEENSRLVLELLREVAEDGRAVLVASHDPLAQANFPHQAELREGRLAYGSP